MNLRNDRLSETVSAWPGSVGRVGISVSAWKSGFRTLWIGV
jgi:hypothetical protein